MELNHLRCFYEVAKAQSFTAAGLALHVSQSSLSKSVALLEERESIQLLVRSKKGVSLTTLGLEVFKKCQTIFNNVDEIQSLFQGFSLNIEGPLRFGVSDHFAKYILVDKLKTFNEAYPGVTPSIFVGSPLDITNQLLKNEIEFGLFFTKLNIPGLEYEKIRTYDLVLVTKKHSAENKNLKKSKIIGSIARDFTRHPSHQIFEQLNIDQKMCIETNNQDLQKMFCLSGQGYTLLAKFMVENEIKNKQLKLITLKKPITTDLYLVHRKNYIYTKAAKQFIEEIVLKL